MGRSRLYREGLRVAWEGLTGKWEELMVEHARKEWAELAKE